MKTRRRGDAATRRVGDKETAWRSSFAASPRRRVAVSPFFFSWLIIPLLLGSAAAQQLPIKTYTAADGLAQNSVNRVFFDSQGFVWVCTRGGLSRFDGYKFTNYGTAQGLPDPNVTDMAEAAPGAYWLGTDNGLVYFNPKGQPQKKTAGGGGNPAGTEAMFKVFTAAGANEPLGVNALLKDRAGVIWCGTDLGLLRVEPAGDSFKLIPTQLWQPQTRDYVIKSLFEDQRGNIWVGAFGKIYCRALDGSWQEYAAAAGVPRIEVLRFYEDRNRTLWVGTGQGLLELARHPAPQRPLVRRTFGAAQGLPGQVVLDLWQDASGVLWAGTDYGLANFVPGKEVRFNVLGKDNGLTDYYINRLAGDRYGNLWLSTSNNGVMKVLNEGFTTFGYNEGVLAVPSAMESRDGALYFLAYVARHKLGGQVSEQEIKAGARNYYWRVGRFDQRDFTWVRPNVPAEVSFSYGWNQVCLQDQAGEWWIATRSGIYRFAKPARFEDLARARPKAVYTMRDGLVSNEISRLFEDSRGDIWIATRTPPANGLARWERKTGVIHDLSQADRLPSLKTRNAISFAEDRAGNVWIGFDYPGGLARYRDGRIESFDTGDGLSEGAIFDLFVDQTGRLWISSTVGGLARIDDPTAARFEFIRYTTAQGLSSDKVTCLTTDARGTVYIGTGRGVDRLDPTNGNVKQFTQADGLAPGQIDDILRDRAGNIWFATTQGLSRLTPQATTEQAPPPILIDSLRVRGVPRPLSALGEADIALPALAAADNQIEIEFVGLSFLPGEALRYQYRLVGARDDWSAATEQRTVNYANLAPGQYRFMARAINSEGLSSARAAAVSFTILPPFYRRWWFLVPALLVTGLLVYALYRYRVAQLLALERVRTRIASDLHDDIGANLSRIAMLSEVARQRLTTADAEVSERLARVAGISRESVDALADIVWAINPARDRLSDLTQRMRRVADDFCAARGIEFRFAATPTAPAAKLDADTRREVLLIFKECLNNSARHSGCTAVEVDFKQEDGQLVLQVSDDGQGITPDVTSDGHGLLNMRQRARALGGDLEIISAAGQGTTVRLRCPLKVGRRKRQ